MELGIIVVEAVEAIVIPAEDDLGGNVSFNKCRTAMTVSSFISNEVLQAFEFQPDPFDWNPTSVILSRAGEDINMTNNRTSSLTSTRAENVP